jgi:predicted N-acyltransferase
MKKDDFIKSLKSIKRHIEKNRKKVTKSNIKTQNIDLLCNCKSSDGSIKNLYLSYEDAYKKTSYLLKTNTILNIYQCPNGYGWHLTKR